ncbi:hypothetical protein [Bacteroides sp. BFG-606]|uniref:hypothetical protein n=1 Tax=Bacteroides sp. BFG-606 TaxID=2972763 RepID=UPI002164F3A4|nr:hypothetical protein [Bacteroides sp. BFG-606]MCS2335467.1 hypothetical protein [Bacteroides sp. BFG-606]
MTIKEFLIKSDVCRDQEGLRKQIEKLPKPEFIGNKRTPSDLNDITMGQLIMLQSMADSKDVALIPCKTLLCMEEKEILSAKAETILGFSMWVITEVDRINKLFSSTSVKPTKEEKQAGVEKLSFGMFGMIDHYALRMGIANHEDVEKVPWIRIYKCLDIDSEKAKFQRRLQEVYARNNKLSK